MEPMKATSVRLTREAWLHIVDVCDKSLEKYYLRIKK